MTKRRARRRSAGHRLIAGFVGYPALAVGIIAAAPTWWWGLARNLGVVAVKHWLATLCFVVAAAAFSTAVGRWWWPWLHERPSTWVPVTSRIPLLLHIVMLVLLSVTVFAGLAWATWQSAGQPDPFPTGAQQLPDPGQPVAPHADWTIANTLDAIKILLSVVVGIGGIVALTIAYRKQDLGEAAEYREDTRLFIERFGRAADQLGVEKAAVRIAGVYSLARLADEWKDGRQTCIDVLCAYLRMVGSDALLTAREEENRSIRWRMLGRPTRKTKRNEHVASEDFEQHVRDTVVRLIRGHLLPSATTSWQEHTFDLVGASLRDADLSGIALQQGTRLILASATISGRLNFRGLHMVGGSIELIDAKPRNAWINFTGAKLEGGELDFYGMKFEEGTDLVFTDAVFAGATVSFKSNSFGGGVVNLEAADFVAGVVEFAMPQRWDYPPSLPDPLPQIVHLPPQRP